MQKQKINYSYIVISASYTSVSCGLYEGPECVDSFVQDKMTVSKNLMVNMNALLKNNAMPYQDLSFIAVNCGPSPFTTLRVVIATVNGLLCALNIPLIAVDGLKAFLHPYDATEYPVVALLNAFNNDLYFGIKIKNSIKIGWEFYGTFLYQLSCEYKDKKIMFIGNGVALHQELLLNLFPHALFEQTLTEYVELSVVAERALKAWNNNQETYKPLVPLYLKTMEYKEST